jgi:phosphomannomutase/phosphoglucomutase
MGIFREYDIRGIVDLDLTPGVVERIGRAYATLARERGVRTITVGRDGRLSSSTLRNHLIAGLLGSGINVVDLGLCATPLLYFSLFSCEVEGGIMITGSHNAAVFNGF